MTGKKKTEELAKVLSSKLTPLSPEEPKMVTKVLRRLFFPLSVAAVLFFICIVSLSKEEAFYEKGTQIFGTFTHPSVPAQAVPELVLASTSPVDVAAEKKEKEKEKVKEKEEEEEELPPCTVINPYNHGFIDLRELSSSITAEGVTKAKSWMARGYESNHNYTIGICSTPFKSPKQVQDQVNETLVGAYYLEKERYVSIGEFSTAPKFTGRKLTMTYENGSYCGNLVNKDSGERLRKSSILTFVCDREMQAKASVSYVGSANDCNFFFEVRSHHACPTAPQANDLAIIWIFLLILLAALLVYVSGGFLYKHMKVKAQKI